MNDSAFADRLAMAIRERHVTQTEFADALGVSQSTVSRWLGGSKPRRLVLTAIAQTLEISLDWLREGKGDSFYFSSVARIVPAKFPSKKWAEMSETEKEKFIVEMVKDNQRGIGQRVLQLRQAIGVGVREFARMLGFSPSYISRLEGGTRGNVSADFTDKLIQVFGVRRAWISDSVYPILGTSAFPPAGLDRKIVRRLMAFDHAQRADLLKRQRDALRNYVNTMGVSNEGILSMIEIVKSHTLGTDVDSRALALTEILADRLSSPRTAESQQRPVVKK